MDDLGRFLQRRARAAEQRVSLEEALLGGRFTRYALSRLKWVGLARGLGVVTHIVEFTVLIAVFSHRNLALSVVLQNSNLLFDGLWWGALEVMRRRIRSDGTKAFAWQETSRWLSAAMWVGLAVLVAGAVTLGWRWHERGNPGVFGAYALVCIARLVIDLVSRTLYSGIWARQRVYRPLASIMLAEPIGVVLVALSWRSVGVWSFPVGLLLTILVSRGLTIAYTLRAYRVARLNVPKLSLRPPPRKLGTPLRLVDVGWAAAGNLTARVGSAIILATFVRAPFNTIALDPFPFVLQLAVPLLSAASNWARVFYHDLKRLEGEAAAALSRKLERRLLVVSIFVGVVAWAGVAAVAAWRVDLAAVRRPVVALGPLCVALSFLSVLQLRELARGGFIRLFLGSAAACVAVLIAIWHGASTDAMASLMLASALSVGALVLAIGGRAHTSSTAGLHRSIESWARSLASARGPTRVGGLRLEASGVAPRMMAERWAARLGRHGAVALPPDRKRLLWFEEAPFEAPPEERAALAAGLGRSLMLTEVAADGRRALERAVAEGFVREPTGGSVDEQTLMAEFRQRFPDGLAATLDDAGTDMGFATLAPRLRRRLWRDALRPRPRRDLPYEVTAFKPAGAVKLIFAVPRASSREDRIAWRARVEAANWCCAVGPNVIRSDGDPAK